MSETEVRGRIVSYLVGRMSLRELDEALTPGVWDAQEPDEATRSLANRIALRIDEYSSGMCTEDELKAALRPLVTTYSIRQIITGVAAAVFTPHIETSSNTSYGPSPTIGVTTTFAGTRRAEALS